MHSTLPHPTPSVPLPSRSRGWRQDAAHIVEELFRATNPEHWNLLLDLREQLILGNDWELTLNCFLGCRELLEADHYLPFYRLRKLISSSLKLQVDEEKPNVSHSCLARALRKRHRSLSDIRRAVSRELYEQDLGLATPGEIRVRLVERL